MSATQKGFRTNEVKAQPGFRPRRTQNGTWEGSHTFAIKRSDWGNSAVRNRFAKGTAVTALDPDLDASWNFLKVVEQEILHDEGDVIMVGVTLAGGQFVQYGGGDGLSPEAIPTYRLSGYLQEAPISQHEKWEDLPDDDKNALSLMLTSGAIYEPSSNEVGNWIAPGEDSPPAFKAWEKIAGGKLKITSDNGKQFAIRINRGDTTFERSAIGWTESSEGTSQLNSAQLNKLGKISTPRGSPPEPSGGRNWRLTSASQDQTGEVFSTTLEWMLSEAGGYDDFLYGD